MTQLTGKVALVTGGSRGIGAAIAKRLARDGADVAITYVSSPEKANAVTAEIKATGRRGVAIQADSADAKARPVAEAPMRDEPRNETRDRAGRDHKERGRPDQSFLAIVHQVSAFDAASRRAMLSGGHSAFMS